MAQRPVFIGSNCIIENRGRFFLLAEIEAKVPGVEIDPVVIIRITRRQAERLLQNGVKRCRIFSRIPPTPPGLEREFKCIFQDRCDAFRIFEFENSIDEAFLVRTSLERACQLVQQGARRCTVISRPF